MSIKRIFAAGFFSLTLAVSGMAYTMPVMAEDDTDSAGVLHEAEAKNSGGTSAFEAGDKVVLEFSETTNKFGITAGNIMDEFSLSSDHTFLDGAGALGSATWSDDGEKLTIVLSAGTSLPTVKVGDTVTYEGSNIKDMSGNVITGDAVIEGSFTSSDDDEDECDAPVSTSVSGSDDDEEEVDEEDNDSNDDEEDIDEDDADEDEDDEEGEEDDEDKEDEDDDCDDSDEDDHGKFRCGTGLQNGRLYKVDGSDTVYLMADCRLKPFRGIAAFNSRGHKFSEITSLPSFPGNSIISDDPAVPAEGTLVKGSDATVYFIGKNGKRKGFTSEQVFRGLGFSFEKVDQISDSDLGTIENDDDLVDDSNEHPDGALLKCGNSGTVFKVIDNLKFAFANLEAFNSRGHSFEHVLVVDCGRFSQYKEAAPIVQ